MDNYPHSFQIAEQIKCAPPFTGLTGLRKMTRDN